MADESRTLVHDEGENRGGSGLSQECPADRHGPSGAQGVIDEEDRASRNDNPGAQANPRLDGSGACRRGKAGGGVGTADLEGLNHGELTD
jgi:hypothetical protein